MNDFEARLTRLETIADQLRDGTVPLNDATELYEEGIKLARTLDRELRSIEQRVEVLSREPVTEDEPPELTLFEDAPRNPDSSAHSPRQD